MKNLILKCLFVAIAGVGVVLTVDKCRSENTDQGITEFSERASDHFEGMKVKKIVERGGYVYFIFSDQDRAIVKGQLLKSF